MRIIPLTIIGMYMGILSAFSQTSTPADSTYKSRKLKVDEVNIVSGYYQQNGNNSAVTGGIGTEHLTDIANSIDLNVSRYGRRSYIKHHFNFELGVDTYTSASSDKIDPTTISSASMSDVRVYPSLSWNIENEQKRTNFGLIGSFSKEFDYTSIGGGVNFSKSSKDKNTDVSLKLQAFLDTWKVILPVELRTEGSFQNRREDDINYPSSPRNSFSASLSVSQVINKRLQGLVMIDPTYQDGLLATKYQRVYFTDNSLKSENLPGSRYKLPIGLRLNYFLGDKIILRSFYRYYTDNWGIKANTIELETPIKITPFVSLSPVYRFYKQTQADYFAPYGAHQITDSYFTSDYDLSKFNSNFLGMGIRLAPPKGVMGWERLKTLELRYGHYSRTNGLNSNIISMNLRFK